METQRHHYKHCHIKDMEYKMYFRLHWENNVLASSTGGPASQVAGFKHQKAPGKAVGNYKANVVNARCRYGD